jgi:hypothetical protein
MILTMVIGIAVGAAVLQLTARNRDQDSRRVTQAATETSKAAVSEPVLAPPLPVQITPIAETPAPGLSSKESEIVKTIYARFATGDFVGALKLADQHLTARTTSDGLHKWIMEQMPALLSSAGWTRLRLGDCEEAIGYFMRADVIRRSPESTKGLALCHYKQKNFVSAREHFDAFLEKNPGDHQMQILLTDVLESEGRYDQAVKILEKTVTEIENIDQTKAAYPDQMPDVDVLKNRLKGMKTKAAVSKHQLSETSQNFRLSYRAGDHEELVGFVLTTLEEALDEYIENYGFLRPVNQIEVILYEADNFRSVVAGGPEWAEGIFDGRLRIPVRETMLSGDPGGLKIILRHELTHAMTASVSDNRTLPPWFEEGLAQKLSCPGGECGPFRFPPTPGGFLPEKAFATSYISLASDKASRAYGQSLYLIHVLQRLRGADVLRQIVGNITTSSDNSADGLLKPAGISFADLHGEAARLWERGTSLP